MQDEATANSVPSPTPSISTASDLGTTPAGSLDTVATDSSPAISRSPSFDTIAPHAHTPPLPEVIMSLDKLRKENEVNHLRCNTHYLGFKNANFRIRGRT